MMTIWSDKMNNVNQNRRGLIYQDVLGLAVTMVEDGRGFDEFEDKFQEHYASVSNLPAITFYNLADWVVNTYKPMVLKDMMKRTEEVTETCDEENKEERPKIQQISVRHRVNAPGGPYTDDAFGADLSLRIHDGYVDISDIDGKRYLCHEEDISSIACFPVPAKKEEKDG
jgi:hypothetical protein